VSALGRLHFKEVSNLSTAHFFGVISLPVSSAESLRLLLALRIPQCMSVSWCRYLLSPNS
jgi:hypothetical protein